MPADDKRRRMNWKRDRSDQTRIEEKIEKSYGGEEEEKEARKEAGG